MILYYQIMTLLHSLDLQLICRHLAETHIVELHSAEKLLVKRYSAESNLTD